jgi:hypothetical protein
MWSTDDIVGMTDIYNPVSVAGAYFWFAHHELNRADGGVYRNVWIEFMLLIAESLKKEPSESASRSYCLHAVDELEMLRRPSLTGPEDDKHENWGEALRRLKDFESRLRAKCKKTS